MMIARGLSFLGAEIYNLFMNILEGQREKK